MRKAFKREERAGATGLAARILLIAGSVLVSLAILEAGTRLLRWGPEGLVRWPNIARERMSIPAEGDGPCTYVFDETLGWRSPANCISPPYNSDADGFRRTPEKATVSELPVLATGASFTKGEEVGDGESWPAYLQDMIGRKVLNAGVSGYALDQTMLSTDKFARQVKPFAIIVSFTPGDIRRSEFKVAWSRQKPYFAVKGDELELRNVPVPGRPHAPVPIPVAARLLGWSALADEVAKALGIYAGWYFDEVRAEPPGTGEKVACLLMPKLASLGVPVVVLAQYGRNYWKQTAERRAEDARAVGKVLGCAAEAGLIPYDLAVPMKSVIEARGLDALYRTDHHSAEGNRGVADLVMHELVRRRLLTPSADR